MANINDEELTKLAIQEILKDAKRFKDKRDAEFRATQMKRPLQANKPFLKNTLRDVMSFNRKRSQPQFDKGEVKQRAKRKLLNKGCAHGFTKKVKSDNSSHSNEAQKRKKQPCEAKHPEHKVKCLKK